MNVPLGDTYEFLFTTRQFSDGAPTTLSGTPVLSVYEEANLTQITSGVSVSADYDGVTGLNQCSIVATSGNLYEVGKYYSVVITTGTVGGTSVVGEVIGHFRAVAAEGVAGVPDVNITHVGDTAQTAGDLADLITTVDTVVDGIQTDLSNGTDGLGAIKGDTANILTDTAAMQPTIATNLDATVSSRMAEASISTAGGAVNTVTTLTNKTGFSLAATGLDLCLKTATGVQAIALAVWEYVISGSIGGANSAAKRITALQEQGGVYGGYIWIDGDAGNTNTDSYIDGTSDNPVSTIAAALTISGNVGITRFKVAQGTTITLTSSAANLLFEGEAWTLALGNNAIDAAVFIGADVSGIGTTTTGSAVFIDCNFIGTSTLPEAQLRNCSFSSSTITLGTDDYDFINCQSIVPGTSAPTFACGSPGAAQNISFRRWSGGITLSGISTNTTCSIDTVSGGTVTLGGADGNVQVRGLISAITDNRSGSPTLGQNAAVNISKVNAEVVDALVTDALAESTGVPAANASLAAKIAWLATLSRNKITQTATTQTLRNDADGADIATAGVSDAAGTFTRDEWS